MHFTSSSIYDIENVAARLFEFSYFSAIAKTSPFEEHNIRMCEESSNVCPFCVVRRTVVAKAMNIGVHRREKVDNL